MSEAEKKWKNWIRERVFDSPYEINLANETREAYKAALKREIEKRIPESPDTFDEYVIGTRAAMKTILELLDTVEPND